MPPPDPFVPRWYVLHTRSRFESVVDEGLRAKAVETFLPRIFVPSRRRDRRITLHVPLFPGYLFVRSDLHPQHHVEILKTIGAVRLVGSQAGPVPVTDETVDSLKIMVAAPGPISTGQRFKKGDPVLVIRGPFAGIVGVFVRQGTQDRVVVNVDVLGQFAAVSVPEEDVEPLPPLAAAPQR